MNKYISAFLIVSISFIVVQTNNILKNQEDTSIAELEEIHTVPAFLPQPDPAQLINRNNSLDIVNESVDIISISKISIPKQELTCLATNIYHEARGESDTGKVAVAHVTLNRVNSPRYPDSICGVVYQAVHSRWWLEERGRLVPVRNMCQFTWYCDGKSDAVDPFSKGWQDSVYIAMAVLVNKYNDPTQGATHYYNYHLVKPDWSYVLAHTTTIDNHTFYRDTVY